MVGDSLKCQETPSSKELQVNGVVLVFVGAVTPLAFCRERYGASVMSLKYGNLFSAAGVLSSNQGGYNHADCENNYTD